MKKEGVGDALKKAARIIPGIGSYQDRETTREADKALREQMSRRLDELIGLVEWIKTDQAKKGGWKKIKDLEELSRDLETASRMIERAARGYSGVFDRQRIDEEALSRLYTYDEDMWRLIDPIEEAIRAFTEKGNIPEPEKIKAIRKSVLALQDKVKKRDQVLKETGA
ncbi:MAG: hypothetical protein JRJ75_09775 [Deltaproteobacteria bacterium]|nr:hypothetical protein [Deltaproteobacteria bacterium]MBW1929294.1 hypothetical protein [Deltaproteobacteria bacterium]RLB21747.1 MAG: hypothetical protein DRG76_08325 [Deltaproteobacteria bacterium]